MAAALQVRNDYSGNDLRRLARTSDDADQTRRLLALAVIFDGGSRGDAARAGGVGLQVIRDWVLRFNTGGPDALKTRKAPGKKPILTDDQRTQLAAAVEAGPRPYVDGVVRWLLVDLAQWAHEELGVSVSRQTLGRELRAMGYAKMTARPQHYAQDEDAIDAFKKSLPPIITAIRVENGWSPVEIWFQDEARFGQKNKITRHWARRGTRPRAPHDQRTKWAYIFGAICPAEGKGAGLVMPYCDTHAMAEHLKLISAEVATGAHAILLLDQAGWHTSSKLTVPDNITLVPIPLRSPELNPIENVWQFLRDNWLSNRVFKNCDDIVALCCESWNKLMDQPWRITSIGRRKWAHEFRSVSVDISWQ
ncbi:MAG: IS630 family transposase [Paracoccaceae bacterium]|nr:IS630 family transposase [Paracoccaceae bacterium]